MIPLVGLHFDGATLTEQDDLAPGTATLGRPVWTARALLGNLELRLGLPGTLETDAIRVQRWSRLLAEVSAKAARFYSTSYAVDPLGTATTLLAWRDALVDGGWSGESIPEGGERLAVLRELEAGGQVPPGRPDLLRRVEEELRSVRSRPFDELLLAEPCELWPGRWRRVFSLLEGCGTAVRVVEPVFDRVDDETDLACVQALLRGDAEPPVLALRGDGSLIVLRGETSWELGHSVAALLRASGSDSGAVLRGGDRRPLDFALEAQGLATQGVLSSSPWRPVLQVLPLAVELAFAPRDPYRVLELLTLPIGPFQGRTGGVLARALREAPGIGGRAWLEARESITDPEQLARVVEWLEVPGHDREDGAPREAMLAVANRVRTWVQGRLASANAEVATNLADAALAAKADMLGAAYAQVQSFHEALAHEPRERLDLVSARLLVERIAGSEYGLTLAEEQAGRIDPVDSPASLRRSRDVVVWWHCVEGTQWRPGPQPWRKPELDALLAAGVMFPDPAALLATESRSWRRAVLAARRRLILAIPRWALGQTIEPHPIWDEIGARLGASDASFDRVTRDARDLLKAGASALGSMALAAVVDMGPLPLPEARPEWRLPASRIGPGSHHSASSLESLVGCPLQWVLDRRAGLRPGVLRSLKSGPLLSGAFAHRLVEELHRSGALAAPDRVRAELGALIDRMVPEEAAVLLRPGMAFELTQLRRQLAMSIAALADLLSELQLTVKEVEAEFTVAWRGAELLGRLDLLLQDATGREVVVDMKWGHRRYHDLLVAGLALQLAIYTAARRLSSGAEELPPAAYFSLSRGKFLAAGQGLFPSECVVAGPSLADTWARLERTIDLVEKQLAAGRVPVTGVKRALPLVESAGVPETERDRYVSLGLDVACEYCDHAPVCGRAWEGLG